MPSLPALALALAVPMAAPVQPANFLDFLRGGGPRAVVMPGQMQACLHNEAPGVTARMRFHLLAPDGRAHTSAWMTDTAPGIRPCITMSAPATPAQMRIEAEWQSGGWVPLAACSLTFAPAGSGVVVRILAQPGGGLGCALG